MSYTLRRYKYCDNTPEQNQLTLFVSISDCVRNPCSAVLQPYKLQYSVKMDWFTENMVRNDRLLVARNGQTFGTP